MKNISLIVPVDNNEAELPEFFAALEELSSSDTTPLEKIIFVDDGSKDKSYSYLLHNKLRLEYALRAHGHSTEIDIVSYPKSAGFDHAVALGQSHVISGHSIVVELSDFHSALETSLQISSQNA